MKHKFLFFLSINNLNSKLNKPIIIFTAPIGIFIIYKLVTTKNQNTNKPSISSNNESKNKGKLPINENKENIDKINKEDYKNIFYKKLYDYTKLEKLEKSGVSIPNLKIENNKPIIPDLNIDFENGSFIDKKKYMEFLKKEFGILIENINMLNICFVHYPKDTSHIEELLFLLKSMNITKITFNLPSEFQNDDETKNAASMMNYSDSILGKKIIVRTKIFSRVIRK